ncbi:MAG TPA: hypothetical protein PKD85_04260 [Saprospiraceae bacterium]|nr:hypothetical protein [Saprospiraceae bacterium]
MMTPANTLAPKREIMTENNLQKELQEIMVKVLGPWIQVNQVNFASVILASMHVIEQFTSNTSGLSSADKMKYALDLLPQIVDFAVQNGKLTVSEGETLKSNLLMSTEIVKQIINAYVLISKNPTVIQMHEKMHEFLEAKFGCCGPTFHKKK